MSDERDKDVDRWVRAESDDFSEPTPKPGALEMTRRKALIALGGAGAAGVGAYLAGRETFLVENAGNKRRRKRRRGSPTNHGTVTTTAPPVTEAPVAPALWSDPATWGGAVPGAGDVAVISRPIILDIDTQVAGVRVESTGDLSFDPAVSRTLASTGNVIVHGVLRMRPNSAAIHHLLNFVGVNEGNFVGGHTDEPLDSDVGLWVLHAGILDLAGSQKTAWTNLAAAAGPGAATIDVDDAAGWQVGDEIVVTPTEPSSGDDEHWSHHDRRTVTAIAGKRVSLDSPLSHAHPHVTVKPGVTQRAEVLNISRNVRIEGTEAGRAHVILLHAMKPQKLGWVGLRHMGAVGVLGRYGLHFHMCGDGVRGSTVDGLVNLEGGNHAFVVHLSNGVALRNCVAHDVVDDAYWWDPHKAVDQPMRSNDVLYERCVASFVHDGTHPHGTCGFLLAAGQNNVARGCVVSGVKGRSNGAGGYAWPDGHEDGDFAWVFEDNLAHNNAWMGLRFWQNGVPRSFIDRFTVYHTAEGIFAGSYANLVSYRDCTVYACTDHGLVIHAITSSPRSGDETITYEGMYVDQAGLTDFAAEISDHTVEGTRLTYISNCTFKGGNTAQLGFPTGGVYTQNYEIANCAFEGNAFWVAEGVPANSHIRVADRANGSVMLHPPGGPGENRSDWNATITSA